MFCVDLSEVTNKVKVTNDPKIKTVPHPETPLEGGINLIHMVPKMVTVNTRHFQVDGELHCIIDPLLRSLDSQVFYLQLQCVSFLLSALQHR